MLFSTFLVGSALFGQAIVLRKIPFGFVILPLIVLSALQFEVGTDYQSYLWRVEEANAQTFMRKFEYGFAFLVLLSSKMGWPQSIFVFSSLLQYTLLLYFCGRFSKHVGIKSGILRLLLVFALLFYANVAANQLNLLRFYIALPIFGILLLELNSNVKLSKVLFFALLSASFHFSFLFLALLALVFRYFNISWVVSIVSGFALNLAFGAIGNLAIFYSPLSRLGELTRPNLNLALTDVPLCLTYVMIVFALYFDSSKRLQPFVILHFLMMVFIFGPAVVSERLSYVVYFLTVCVSLVLLQPGLPKIIRQLQYFIYAAWFLLPLYKFFIFNSREYSYQWIL